MRLIRARRGVLGGVIVSLVVIVVGRAIRDRNTARHTERLRRTADTDRSDLFTMEDLDDVPQPVREYFANVLRDGQQYVNTAQLEQEGELRSGDADSEWKPFTTTQYITTDPPGFSGLRTYGSGR